MYSFETLLRASADEVLAIFAATRVGPLDDHDQRREQIARQLGVKTPQMLCGFGFNSAMPGLDNVCHGLGFSNFAALAVARNYAFIHDVYAALSINNILEIYGAMQRLEPEATSWSDLVMTRIGHIESQLEETINPILIGGYKLEIRGIYENHLASPEFVRGRMTAPYVFMRDIANENAIMLECGVIEPAVFLRSAGITAEEKRRAIFGGQIPPAEADRYIREVSSPEEQQKLREALTGASS